MISKIILLVLLGVALCRVVPDSEVAMEFGKFIKKYKMDYDSVQETIKRYNIFADNYRYIVAENSKNGDVKLAVNQFADITPEEMKAYLLKYKKTTKPCTLKHIKPANVKDVVDWREKKVIARVKNQGNCGSCWAFSAIAAIESLQAIKSGKVIEYSEQELVDCSVGWGDNHGCKGGDMSQAFEYVAEKGISLESEYPYKGRDGTCKKVSSSYKIKGCVNVTADDSIELLQALNIEPISIAVKADNRKFMYYSSGIITSGCGSDSDELDHGILLVAALKEGETPYWVAKNSWGAYWGKRGFVQIKRDTTKGHGVCGIAMENAYPIALA
ncbi:MAG: C1 family peptidase [Acidobacteriaceae bacterium]|nr:C1 family peptidase [Acidobacteriaceae bacterium]